MDEQKKPDRPSDAKAWAAISKRWGAGGAETLEALKASFEKPKP